MNLRCEELVSGLVAVVEEGVERSVLGEGCLDVDQPLRDEVLQPVVGEGAHAIDAERRPSASRIEVFSGSSRAALLSGTVAWAKSPLSSSAIPRRYRE